MALGAVRKAGKWAGVRMLPTTSEDLLGDLVLSAKRTVGYMRSEFGRIRLAVEGVDELEELVRKSKAVLARVVRNAEYREESATYVADAYWRSFQTPEEIARHERRIGESLVRVVEGLEELSEIYGRFMVLWEPVLIGLDVGVDDGE